MRAVSAGAVRTICSPPPLTDPMSLVLAVQPRVRPTFGPFIVKEVRPASHGPSGRQSYIPLTARLPDARALGWATPHGSHNIPPLPSLTLHASHAPLH